MIGRAELVDDEKCFINRAHRSAESVCVRSLGWSGCALVLIESAMLVRAEEGSNVGKCVPTYIHDTRKHDDAV